LIYLEKASTKGMDHMVFEGIMIGYWIGSNCSVWRIAGIRMVLDWVCMYYTQARLNAISLVDIPKPVPKKDDSERTHFAVNNRLLE
jgi:hypothetical protein